MNEFEELQNLWQNEGLSSKAEAKIIPLKNINQILEKVKNLQKRWFWGNLIASLGFGFTSMVLLVNLLRMRYQTLEWGNGISFLVLIIMTGISLVWWHKFYTPKDYTKSTLTFVEQKIHQIKLRKQFICYLTYLIEGIFVMGINLNFWDNFLLFTNEKRIITHISMTITSIVAFEIIQAIVQENWKEETNTLLDELSEIRNQLKNEED